MKKSTSPERQSYKANAEKREHDEIRNRINLVPESNPYKHSTQRFYKSTRHDKQMNTHWYLQSTASLTTSLERGPQ